MEESAILVIPANAKVNRINGVKRGWFRQWWVGIWSSGLWGSKAATLGKNSNNSGCEELEEKDYNKAVGSFSLAIKLAPYNAVYYNIKE